MPSLFYTGLSFWIRRQRLHHHHNAALCRSVIADAVLRRQISIPSWLSGSERQRLRERKSKNTGSVNWYEETDNPDGSKDYRNTTSESKQNLDEIDRFASRIDDATSRLEKDLEAFKAPKSIPESIVNQFFDKEERQRVADALQTMTPADFDFNAHRVKVITPLSRSQTIVLRNFNDMMDRAAIDVQGTKIRKDLWRSYQRAKIYVPQLSKAMTDAAWKILWLSQSEEVDTNHNRLSHLRVLVDDLASAGKVLTQEQQNTRIEGLFQEGQREKALALWEERLKVGNAGSNEFLELGIRMYAHSGNLARAEDLLDVLLKLHPSWNPEIAYPVVSGFLDLGNDEACRRAYALYLRLCQRLGSEMTAEHYDAISLEFLNAGRKDLAMAVFKDMMLASEVPASDDGVKMQQLIYQRFGDFLSLGKDVQQVNELSLEALTVLPRRLQNAFFYAKWLKRLLETDEVEAAEQVIDLMYERGIRPNPRHVNGIIVRWLSSPNRADQQRGVELAWNMIQARLDFVQKRRSQQNHEMPDEQKTVLATKGQAHVPVFKAKPVPAASTDTFSILVRFYLRNESFENVRQLRNLLVDAHLKMDSHFMNALLMAEAKHRGHQEVWTRFQMMSRTVSSNLQTYIVLWEGMKFFVDRNPKHSEESNYPQPRELFSMMMAWFNSLRGYQRENAISSLSSPIYEDILRCFLLRGDVAGCFVAVQALREAFSIFPQPTTFRMLIVQITKMNFTHGFAGFGHPDMEQEAPSKDDAMMRTAEILGLITERRRELLSNQNTPFDGLHPEYQNEENHRMVLQFLSVILQQRSLESADSASDEKHLQYLIHQAADEMGVEHTDYQESISLVDISTAS